MHIASTLTYALRNFEHKQSDGYALRFGLSTHSMQITWAKPEVDAFTCIS